MNRPLRILVEDRTEALVLEGILRDFVDDGRVLVARCWELSSLIAIAQRALIEGRDASLAIVVNGGLHDPTGLDELRGQAERLLAAASPTGWHVATASPDILAWAEADPAVAAEFGRLRTERRGTKYDLAVAFKDFTRPGGHRFDRERLCRVNPEFRALWEFIEHAVPSELPVGS